MLVLSRRVGETIIIGRRPHLTRITVVSVDGRKCKIGIDVPDKATPVHREEIFLRIEAEQRKYTGDVVDRQTKGDV